MIVIVRVRGDVRADAVAALRVLGAQTGCRAARLGRSLDSDDDYVLITEWESVGAYRRGLSAYDVKVGAVPVLLGAADEPTAYEVLYDTAGPSDTVSGGDRAPDAGTVRVGEASGPGEGWTPEAP